MNSKIDKNTYALNTKALQGLSSDEKSAPPGLLNSRRKYGLVWEEKEEAVEELLGAGRAGVMFARKKQTFFIKLRYSVLLNRLLMLRNSMTLQQQYKGNKFVTFTVKTIEFDGFVMTHLFNCLNCVKKTHFFLHRTRHLIKKTTFFYISGGFHAVYA